MLKKFIINDEIIFDPQQHTLMKTSDPDEAITLNSPASKCLNVLLTHKGLVTHNELYEKGWSDSPQEPLPNTLYQNILLIRQAFRKLSSQDTDFVITVPRRGFYFSTAVKIAFLDRESHLSELSDKTEKRESPEVPGRSVLSLSKHIIHFQHYFKKNKSYSLINFLLILSSIIILFFTVYLIYESREKNYLNDNYTYTSDIQQCRIFLSNTNIKEGKDKYDTKYLSTLLKKSYSFNKNNSCINYPIRYITILHTPLRSVMIACTNDKDAKKNRNCTTIYIRDGI
ncbi:TPA: winged helix-turn-helix domain-containing protein [Klebsiella quasipneumoniae subsp. similipneumoniae]